MRKLSFESGDVIWPAIIGIIAIQIIVSMLIFFVYPLLAWFFFGEGANSYLFTKGNIFTRIILPVLLPTVLNLYRIYIAKKVITLEPLRLILALKQVYY